MASLVFGFIHAASDGWANGVTLTAFVLAVVLLLGFVALEGKLSYAMMPLRALRNRDRSGAYLVMLIVGAALFGMFFFVSYFVQGVLGYSALKSGLAFLPVSVAIGVAAQLSASLLARVGPRRLVATGTVTMMIGLFWLATINADSGYLTHLLPSLLVFAFGVGLTFVPLTTVAVSGVEPHESGLASALLNVGQQVGGSIGLSVLTTVFASGARSEGTHQGNVLGGLVQAGKLPGAVMHHFQELVAATSSGAKVSPVAAHDNVAVHAVHEVQAHASSMGFLTAALFGVLAVVVTLTMIRTGKDVVIEVDPSVAVAAAEA